MERRRGFTLIELFLTLGLIAMVGSVILFRAKPMLDHYYYMHGIAQLKREITFSKHLAQTANADIEFHITAEKGKLRCIRKTDEPLNLFRAINTPIFIARLRLEGKKSADTTFTASGAVLGDQELTLSNGTEKTTINLASG